MTKPPEETPGTHERPSGLKVARVRIRVTKLFPAIAAAGFGAQLHLLGFDAVFLPSIVLFAAIQLIRSAFS